MPCKIIIYEDNTRLRRSLELLINDSLENTVVGSYPDCDNVKNDTRELEPQLVIMDIDMPGIGGIEGIRQIKELLPDIKILVHTMFDDDSRVFDCICAGADGYLLKNTSPNKLLESIQSVQKGDVPMSPFVAQKVFQYFKDKDVRKNDFQLTNRELDILTELVRGNSYKMIADVLDIKLDTVRKHLQNIYHKLHVSSGTEAVAKAITEKIIRMD